MAILTISRQYGSGGREIGRAISDMLKYTYVNKEDIMADLHKDGAKWEEWAKDLDEHAPSVWERYDWSFRGFAALIQSHILEHAINDNVVIIGRGGNFLLKGVAHSFRIRVAAPLDVRMERIMKRETVDKETAGWLCEKTDAERSRFIHFVYGKEWDDPAEYDRVFTVKTQAVDDVVQAVKNELVIRDRAKTGEALKTLALLARAAKVKAGIATNPGFFIPVLDVTHDGTSIILRGVTHTPKEHKSIEEAAGKLAGDMPIRCELHYRK